MKDQKGHKMSSELEDKLDLLIENKLKELKQDLLPCGHNKRNFKNGSCSKCLDEDLLTIAGSKANLFINSNASLMSYGSSMPSFSEELKQDLKDIHNLDVDISSVINNSNSNISQVLEFIKVFEKLGKQ